MKKVGGQNECERQLMPLATEAAAKQHGHAEQEQGQADDPRLGEELQGQVVRFDREVEIAVAETQVRKVKRARAATRELMPAEAVPRLPPPDEAEVRARRTEPAGTIADGARTGALHHDEHHRSAREEDTGDEQAPAQRGRDTWPRQPLERRGGNRAGEQQHTEDQAVAPAHVR